MKEFHPIFELKKETSYGSGVHLWRDVSLDFTIMDQQENHINTDNDFLRSPLVSSISYDILSIDGSIACKDFIRQTSTKKFSFSEQDNISVFGEYKKDFIVRAYLHSAIDDSVSVAEFSIFGNDPKIDSVKVIDSEEGKIRLAVKLANNLEFVKPSKFVVLASESEDLIKGVNIGDPTRSEHYLMTHTKSQIEKGYEDITVEIPPLLQGKNIFLLIIPYGQFGNGDPFFINDVKTSIKTILVEKKPYLEISGDYEVEYFSTTINATDQAAILLPKASLVDGEILKVKNSSPNAITITAQDDELIDGQKTIESSTQFQTYTIQSVGSGFILL